MIEGACIGALILASAFVDAAEETRPPLRVGSKAFTESVILGELVTQIASAQGLRATHRRQLGGTKILWAALLRREIDVYPEYTGTIAQEMFSGAALRGDEAIRKALAEQGVQMSGSLGFNNTYAIGMPEQLAQSLGIQKISDLAKHPELKLGFSNESEILYYHLRILEDDRHVFPEYEAVLLYRADLEHSSPGATAAFFQLVGKISAPEMIAMNARAKLERVSESRVAADFLAAKLGLHSAVSEETVVSRILRHLQEHLFLVAISLLAAIAVALPLGVVSARFPGVGQLVLGAVGVIQTIPSLALLVFMIPFLGIGSKPSIVALFLYSLLPIVRNTASGLRSIPIEVRESAQALGLPGAERLRRIELPMASPAILAGIKTSAVINVGTATLGALIGAGGFGQPILTGIRLNDVGLILQGAIPAAVLALLVQGLFELAERVLVPKGLRLPARAE